MTVVGLSGSNRKDSSAHALTLTVGSGVKNAGGTYEAISLFDYKLPPVNTSKEDIAEDAKIIKQKLESADAIFISTPVYHGSFSAQIKCALDYCRTSEFENTIVGLGCVAGGRFATPALNQLRIVCSWLNAVVLPKQIAIPNATDNISQGKVATDTYKKRAQELARQLVQKQQNN
jgi:NAD(P)H-dependent FMN reductase